MTDTAGAAGEKGTAYDADVLARVVAAVASYEGIDGSGNDWTEDSDEPALIALLVLDALGLEQVGWFYRFPTGTEGIDLWRIEADEQTGPLEFQVPAYCLSVSGKDGRS